MKVFIYYFFPKSLFPLLLFLIRWMSSLESWEKIWNYAGSRIRKAKKCSANTSLSICSSPVYPSGLLHNLQLFHHFPFHLVWLLLFLFHSPLYLTFVVFSSFSSYVSYYCFSSFILFYFRVRLFLISIITLLVFPFFIWIHSIIWKLFQVFFVHQKFHFTSKHSHF